MRKVRPCQSGSRHAHTRTAAASTTSARASGVPYLRTKPVAFIGLLTLSADREDWISQPLPYGRGSDLSRDRKKPIKNAPASGGWQAKACPTTVGTRHAVVGHALACLAPIFCHVLRERS